MMGPSHLSRRDLLKAAAHGGASLAAAGLAGCPRHEPAGKPFPPPNGQAVRGPENVARLGLDTYTLHRSLTAKDSGNRRDLWWVIDRLGELGLSGLQIDPSHFPGDDEATLQRLESAVRPRGYYVEFGMGGWDPERLKRRIQLTARFGGRAVRTFCGDERATPQQIAGYLQWAPPALRQAAEAADEYGVSIAVENHGDFTASELKSLLDRVGHPRVGACLDTGNSLFRKEDPLECARALAPYARSMHLKDWTMTFGPDGAPMWKEAVLGTGQVPVREILRIVLAHKRDLFIAVETPIQPGEDETETVRREWEHVAANAAAARRMLAEL